MCAKINDTSEKVVGGGKYMQAIVSIDGEKINIRTHIFTHVKLAGFTGGVLATFSDINGSLLYVTPLLQYGVDGQLIPFKESDRWITDSFDVDSQIEQSTDRIDVWMGMTPKNRLADSEFGRWIGEKIDEFATWLAKKFEEWVKDNMNLDPDVGHDDGARGDDFEDWGDDDVEMNLIQTIASGLFSTPNIFPGNPVAEGQWGSILAGHTLIPMTDGRVLDWVPANGSWRLWNYNA